MALRNVVEVLSSFPHRRGLEICCHLIVPLPAETQATSSSFGRLTQTQASTDDARFQPLDQAGGPRFMQLAATLQF
jgi:hypothetical protein